jgi:hypothetical protein
VEAIVVQHEDAVALFVLADEIAEDRRCEWALVGADEDGAILVTIWDRDTVEEVEAGLRAMYGDRVRRMQLVDPRLS